MRKRRGGELKTHLFYIFRRDRIPACELSMPSESCDREAWVELLYIA